MPEPPRVLVVGAGPTGLAAALKLASLGIVPDLVERREAPSELSRAVGIMPVTMERLDPLGAGAAIRAEAMAIRRFQMFRGEKQLMRLDFSDARYDGRTVLGLPQNRTEELLTEALQRLGGQVQFGRELTQIATTDNEVTATFDGGGSATYDWAIAADGVQSTVREQLGIDYPGFDLDDEWSVADVDVAGYDCQCLTAWLQQPPGEFVIVIPIDRNRVRIASSTSDAMAALPGSLDITNVRRTGAFRIAVRQVLTYQQGRVLLAGDAAHCHSPVGGRGMNLGIADAFAAATAIADGTTEAYTDHRHKAGRRVLKRSEQGRKLVCANGGFTKAMTTLGMAAIHHVPLLRRIALRVLTTL